MQIRVAETTGDQLERLFMSELGSELTWCGLYMLLGFPGGLPLAPLHTLFRMAVNSSAASNFTQRAHHSPTFAACFLFSFVGISDNDANPSGPLDVVVIPSQRMLHG